MPRAAQLIVSVLFISAASARHLKHTSAVAWLAGNAGLCFTCVPTC